jgi:glycogen synthase
VATGLDLISETIKGLVHIHTWYVAQAGAMASKLHQVPFVATAHSLEPLRPWKRDQLGSGYDLSTWLEATGMAAADRIIAVSKEMKRDLLRELDLPQGKVEVVPNGVDTTVFQQLPDEGLLTTLGITHPYVLALGRLTEQKGFLPLVETCEKLYPGVQVVVVTGKEDRPALLTEMEYEVKDQLGDHPGGGKEQVGGHTVDVLRGDRLIWIHGFLSDPVRRALYSGCEVFLCPSIYEPFGIINLEAMACERPVVGFEVGGLREVVVEWTTGRLAEPENYDQFWEKVNQLLEYSAASRIEMGKKGRTRVEQKYSWSAVAAATENIYRQVLKERGKK